MQDDGAGRRILVVDDEPAIRHVVVFALQANGYATFSAANGREAIQLLDSLDEPVQLVFTDMTMPVMDGAALVAHLAAHRPGLPVIVASGFDPRAGIRASGDTHFIAKPFTTDTLLETVAVALGRGAARTADPG